MNVVCIEGAVQARSIVEHLSTYMEYGVLGKMRDPAPFWSFALYNVIRSSIPDTL